MHWGALADPLAIPTDVAAVAMVLLAGWLLYLNVRHRAHWVFAVFLVGTAIGYMAFQLAFTAPTQSEADAWWAIAVYAALPTLPLLAYFIFIFPRPRGWLGRSKAGILLPIAAALLLDLGYALNHHLIGHPVVTQAGTIEFSSKAPFGGPYDVFQGVSDLVAAVYVLLLVLDHGRAQLLARQRSLLLVAAGFAAGTLFDTVRVFLRFLPLFSSELEPWQNVNLVLIHLSTLLLAFAAFRMYRQMRSAPVRETRAGARWFLGFLAFPLLSAVLLRLLGSSFVTPTHPLVVSLNGLWILAVPVLVTYAIVRHQLFDIDIRVRWTIKQSTVAAAFIAVFFVVSGATQTFFQNTKLGPYLGVAAAGLLVFAFAPLQRVAERVALTAIPELRPLENLSGSDRADVYRDQARAAWADGTLSSDERHMLDRLRDRLGLGYEVASRIEAEAAKTAARPVPAETAPRPSPAPAKKSAARRKSGSR